MKFYNCDIYRLKELVGEKRLICFGAGKALKNFIYDYLDMHFEKDIYCIVDNKKECIGNKIKIADVEIPLIDVEQLREIENFILVITCGDIYGVYKQLNSYDSLNDIWCFATAFIRSETNLREEKERYYPQNYRLTKEHMIPKIIHYCWFGKNDIPEQNRIWMETWKKYCPDYEIVRWDESNYDVTKNKYMYEAYKTGKWGFVPDFARLDIIYNYGGIYLDTDVELLKCLDELLYQNAFSGVDSSRMVSLGLGFGAHKQAKIIKELRDLYFDIEFRKRDGSYNLVAAPALQKEYFNSKGYINNGQYQIIEGMTVYPEKVLSAKCNITGRIMPTEHSFAIHHYDGSWVQKTVKTQNMMVQELFKKEVKSLR